MNLSVTIEGAEEVAKTKKRIRDRIDNGASLEEAVSYEIDTGMEIARFKAMALLRSECVPCRPPPSL